MSDYDRVELVWPGKTTEVERVALPFQTIERVNDAARSYRDQSRLERMNGMGGGGNLPDWWPEGWRNKLIWGDNKYVLGSLLDEFAGKVDLIYIDPPFATGADFTYRAQVGEATFEKQPTAVEEVAYRDTWASGVESYLSMMYPRLSLLYDLLSPKGSIYVHCDDTVGHHLQQLLDEIFGRDSFRNHLIWRRAIAHNDPNRYGRIADHVLFYGKSASPYWDADAATAPKTPEEMAKMYPLEDSRGAYRKGDLTGPAGGGTAGESGRPWRGYDVASKGRVWSPPKLGTYAKYINTHLIPGYLDIPGVHARLEALDTAGLITHPVRGFWPQLKRYAVADAGNPAQSIILQPTGFTIYTVEAMGAVGYPTEKPVDLISKLIQPACPPGGLVLDVFCGSGASLHAAEQTGRRWIGADLGRFAIQTTRKRLLDIPDCRPFEVLNLGRYERKHWQGVNAGEAIWEYYRFILQLYSAQEVSGFTHLHGKKAGRMIHVGATDAPVTRDELAATLLECAANGISALDVLGWEWEMGLNPAGRDELAREHGVEVHLLNIPREVMDDRAVKAGGIHFFELSVADIHDHQDDHGVVLELVDFIPAIDEYMQEKVKGKVEQWSDWIDYWSVDSDYDGETFVNRWQAYRTRKEPSLMLRSDPFQYDTPGRKRIVVKVIDIFGNDTTVEKVVEVE